VLLLHKFGDKKMKKNILLFLLFSAYLWSNLVSIESPDVVDDSEIAASIKPMHSLVCAITKGITNPKLLVDGNFSPHHFQITPSQAKAIKKAKVIIWIGPAYEKPLYNHLQNVDASILVLQNCPSIKIKPLRNGAFWDKKSCCSHYDHDVNQMNMDGHIWLDPEIMLQVVDVVLEHLIHNYPNHKEKLKANAANYRVRLKKLQSDLKLKMLPYKGETYIIQHDGNQYFDEAFGTRTIATISIDPSIPPNAGHMLKLRQAVLNKEIHPKCLFSERQMDGALAKNYADSLKIPFGALDYLGTDIPSGEFAYEQIMHAYVDSFIAGITGKA
jgi:zinc transport system substrate-binding protein